MSNIWLFHSSLLYHIIIKSSSFRPKTNPDYCTCIHIYSIQCINSSAYAAQPPCHSNTLINVSLQYTHTHTSSILSPVRRVPLCAAGLSGLMCLMKTPLIISPLLSLRPMPLPPIMLMPRDWPASRISRTLETQGASVQS